jgi:cbb3-type cytochrome oxidase subunit 3
VLGAEVIQFVVALVLFVGILICSYWFVLTPNRRNNRRDDGQER